MIVGGDGVYYVCERDWREGARIEPGIYTEKKDVCKIFNHAIHAKHIRVSDNKVTDISDKSVAFYLL